MKLKTIFPALSMLCLSGCASLNPNSDSDFNSLKARASQVDAQIDNVNYVIYLTYERYQAAKREGGDRKVVSGLEVELSKLQDVKRYLEASQVRVLREIKDTQG